MSSCCCHWPDVLRWCTLSTIEQRKCTDMRDAFQTRGLTPRVECVFGESVKNCLQRIKVDLVFIIQLLLVYYHCVWL